ncbi:MAG: hypothetical protein ACTS8S_23895 [Giesbergeria sp.]
MDTKKILQKNLQALMAHHGISIKGIVSKGAEMGLTVTNGTVGRVHAGKGCNFDNLPGLAEVFELSPWQMLVPGLDPQNHPKLASPAPEKAGADMFDASLGKGVRKQSSHYGTARKVAAAKKTRSK